jgi:hypothetical protein
MIMMSASAQRRRMAIQITYGENLARRALTGKKGE